MIDIDKWQKTMQNMGREEIETYLTMYVLTEDKMKEMYPKSFQDYQNASSIVAKDMACTLLKNLGLSDEEVAEFQKKIEEE